MLAKLFRVTQDEVAFRLRVSTDYLRRLAHDPEQAQRVMIAELEAILDALIEQERARCQQAREQALVAASAENGARDAGS
jgi:hypothetical protein